MIKPFVLRRTKELVAKDLPEKTETLLYCEMNESQSNVYEAFKNSIKQQLLEEIESEGINKARFKILEGLLKLRQICDSPALLKEKEDFGSDSIKAEQLTRIIKEKTGNHKILIFSQFLGMLDIIRKRLKENKIQFSYIDGKTKDREAEVNKFQNDENCRVFLLSIKAGGFGLNLTKADYVYIVDPWWNPAVESQAIDRAHRIGQESHVFAYKMICRNTIEEKIVQLQNRKKKIADDIIGGDKAFVSKLTKDDINFLLD
jgi:non-specific serine/threonine protein kinase